MVWISQLSPDISPRTGASLTSSPDSLFLLCGANHEQGPLSDLYTYSLSSFKWSTSHIPIPPRYDHACSKMSDNLIVFGGCGETGPINDTWIYSIKSQSWREVFNGPCARTIQSMPVISNKAFIFGGGVSGFNAIDDTSIWIFDLINGWSSISTPGPCARQGHSLVAIGASIYMFGGMNGSVSFDDVWKFDTSSNEWSKVATSGEGPMARSGHVACLIDETRIAVYGGLVRDPKARVIGDVFILDTESLEWSQIDFQVAAAGKDGSISGPESRLDCAACTVPIDLATGDVSVVGEATGMLLFGGMDFGATYNDMYLQTFE